MLIFLRDNLNDTTMFKSAIPLFFIIHIIASQDYANIGEYCTETKYAEIPCLRGFCAEIDAKFRLFKNTNGSVDDQLQKL